MVATSHSKPDQKQTGSIRNTSSSGDEQWYFRIDGKNFGPSSRAQLEHFLRPPRLCKTLEVMCTERQGFWHTIGVDETIEMVLERFGIPLPDVPSAAPVVTPKSKAVAKPASTVTLPGWISTPIDRVAELFGGLLDLIGPPIKRFGPYVIIALALFIAGSTAFVMMGGMQISEKQIVSQYDAIWKEATAMSGGKASDQWRQFADKSLAELEPTLRDLSHSSSVQNFSRQQLLFAGRDHLKKMLKADEPPKKFSASARVFERYMLLARKNVKPK